MRLQRPSRTNQSRAAHQSITSLNSGMPRLDRKIGGMNRDAAVLAGQTTLWEILPISVTAMSPSPEAGGVSEPQVPVQALAELDGRGVVGREESTARPDPSAVYIGMVNASCERVGVLHRVTGRTEDGAPRVACGTDTRPMNWTSCSDSIGPVCVECEPHRVHAQAQWAALSADQEAQTRLPPANMMWQEITQADDVDFHNHVYVVTRRGQSERAVACWSSQDAVAACDALDRYVAATQRRRIGETDLAPMKDDAAATRRNRAVTVSTTTKDAPSQDRRQRLDADVATVIAQASLTGRTLTLPDQLDPTLYQRVMRAITKAGGRWNRSEGCHTFDRDPRELFAINDATGAVAVRHVQKELQAFYTPAGLAEELVARSCVVERCAPRVLEPSCGDGRILSHLIACTTSAARIDAYEIDPVAAVRARAIASKPGQEVLVQERDFLSVPGSEAYDVIVMNPPFSKGADMTHVTHALRHLAPQGTLVAVTSAAWRTATTAKATAFRDLLRIHRAEIEEIPAGAFSSSGTQIPTLQITIPFRRHQVDA